MELLPLVCFCILICCGTTFGDEVIMMSVKEDEDVILPCSYGSDNIRSDTFDWKKDDQKEVFLYSSSSHYNNDRGGQDPQFKGRVFHFEDQLQSGNASIEIRKTKKTDSGSYKCIFPFKQPKTRSRIQLLVDCILKDRTEEKIAGSSPKPYVTILHQTDDQALLQCEVQGVFPKPKVQWLDSENKTVPAEEPQETESEGKYNIILKTTVTKSDVYRCVSTQEEMWHQIDQRIHVYWDVIKMRVKEDEDVILPCSLDSTNIRTETFVWKKDNQKEVFLYSSSSHYNNGRGGQDPQFKGRVFHFEDQLQSGNASIEIRNTKMTDSGRYSCSFPFHQPKIRSTIELIVGSCLKPSVTNLDQTDNWALLQCKVQGAFLKPKVQWLDSENKTVPAEEPQETESEGKYNIILKATVTKSDVYRCVSTQEEICHQIDRKINVYLHGAASKPSVKILDETKDWALLQCEVQGVSPKPKVVWKDSAGNIVPAKEPEVTENEGSYNIILKATVTKTDNYRCVSTQEEINHEVHAETYVHLNGSFTGWIVGGVVVAVVSVVAVVGFVLYFRQRKQIQIYKNGPVYHVINGCLQCRQNDKDPAKHEGDTTDKNKSGNHEEMELMSKSDGGSKAGTIFFNEHED